MNKDKDKQEPLQAQSVEYWTFDELLKQSMKLFREGLGVPAEVVEAEKPSEHITDVSELIKDAQ
jgi:hypothetical protein